MIEAAVKKRWSIKAAPRDKEVLGLADEVNIRPELARLLIQRGIRDFKAAKAFFRPSLDDLHDPFLMKDMDKAVDRLSKAIAEGENIMIFGDYDVDGTTSVALVYSFLKGHTESIMYYIPDRYAEGYGLSKQGIDHAADNDISLIITLDCGIKAVDKVVYAQAKGVDIIICDHHRPGAVLPPAVAILDAKQEGCNYPYKELCGCGVGFKFMHAFGLRHGLDQNVLFGYLDLVATAIGADIVPITGENRILMAHGLNMVNTRPSGGIKALLQVADVKKKLSVTDLVFIVAPRINAAGRISHGERAVALLTSDEQGQVEKVANEVNAFNRERKDLDKIITEQALQMIDSDSERVNAKTTVVYKEDWHKGVVGIVASRLIETYYRPTIVLTESNGKATGSARSVRNFDVYNAIEACSDLLENFGGHKYAAGLTMSIDNLTEFQRRFEEVVSNTIDPELLIPEVVADMDLDLDHIDRKFYNVLKQMAPFGPGNMRPVFRSTECLARYAKIVGEKHLKFQVYQQDANRAVNCIAFGYGDKLELLNSGKPFEMLYSIEENDWNGMVSLQLNIKDIRPSS